MTEPREQLNNFHFGRLHAEPLRRFPGRILLEFMREGDEEQHFDMTLEEARAFRDWIDAYLVRYAHQQATQP